MLPFVLGIHGCATSTDDLVKAGRVEIAKAGKADWYVQNVQVHQDEKGMVIHGRVRPGNRSHVPKSYSGHMDILVNAPERSSVFDGIVTLGGKQQYFVYRMGKVPPARSVVTLDYVRFSHSRHAADFQGLPFNTHMESASPTFQKDK
jgi:hypothetical protein